MSRLNSTRHNLPVALLLTALLLIVPAVSANAASQDARYSWVPPKICKVDWRKGTWHVKKLIRCAADHWDVPGGAAKALYIANRESHFDPDAYNASSGAKGIYQHLSRYWPGRAYTYGFKGFSAYNARANIIVTMRMVKRDGWSPWGG
jgi:hypothetical protein